MDYVNSFTHRFEGVITLDNGFFVSHALIQPSGCDLEEEMYQDYLFGNQFEDVFNTFRHPIDEHYLAPSHIRLIQNTYGEKTYNNYKISQFVGHDLQGGYRCLSWMFMNLSDEERSSVLSTYQSIRKEVKDYGDVSDIDLMGDEVKLEYQIQFIKDQIKARQLRNALMCYLSKRPIPSTPAGFMNIYYEYQDQMLPKIKYEIEKVLKADKENRVSKVTNRNRPGGTSYLDGEGEGLTKQQAEELRGRAIVKALEEHKNISPSLSAETEVMVIKREFEVLLLKEGIKMISKHDEALKGALEMGAADNQINAFIMPYQQFASTLYETVDRNPHLDIVSKASFVQQFLTRLRNRCTEVETLTSGPGVVFSMKDFNDCIQTLCRGMIKYCETNIRSLTETNVLKMDQLKHIVYVNERKMFYYKSKCEQFVAGIDNLINAKMTEKNTDLIYELDITHRELRMLKDNYYLMEQMIRDEVRKEFVNELNSKDNKIKRLIQGFDEYRKEIDDRVNAGGYQEILEIGPRIKAKADIYKRTDIKDPREMMKQLQEADKKAVVKFHAGEGPQSSNNIHQKSTHRDHEVRMYDRGNEGDDRSLFDNESRFRDEIESNATDPQYGGIPPYMPSVREELVHLRRALRNQKTFMRMKELMMKEQHEREIANLKQQLTSNQCLWEQLSETQTRESILVNELHFTQQSLATCEKIIEKMKTKIETLQNQRLRLQQYKDNKSKRLDELESKVRQMEILENIDLNKLLDELRLRDRKLSQLTGVEKNLQKKVDSIYKIGEQKVEEMRHKYLQEKRIKESAFSRLESLRMEIRAIDSDSQSYDIWKEKCKELFTLCKELQKENEDLRNTSHLNELHHVTTPEAGSLPENIDSLGSHTHDGKRVRHSKYSGIDRFGAKTLTTKPSTSAQNRAIRKNHGYMSGGSLANALGLNPSEMSPRGSVMSSGIKKVFSKASHQIADYTTHKMPNINQTNYYKNLPKSQGMNYRNKKIKSVIRNAAH